MKKALLIAFLSIASSGLWAEAIDLNGVARTVGADEYAAEFTNTSETLAELTIENAEAATFSGKISGNIRLVKAGAGQLDITTVNDFTGGVDLRAGIINFTVAGSLGSGFVTISSGATLQLGAAVECANPIHLMANGSILKFNVSSGTAAYKGDITGEEQVTSFAPYSVNKNASPRFKGVIDLPNAVLSNSNSKKEGWIYFDGPVKVKSITHRHDNVSGFYFSSAENSWSFVNYNVTGSNKKMTFADGAIPSDSYFTQTAGTRRDYQFNVSGTQSFSYFTHDTASKTMLLHAIAEAVVTLGSECEKTGKSQFSSKYNFTGPLSIVYAPQQDNSKWVLSGGASTMKGALTVERGILSIEGTATFANVTNVVVKETGTFSCTSAGTDPLKSLKHVNLSNGATFNLGEGIEIVLDSFLVDGKAPKVYGWFTGADNESPVEGDLKTLTQLKGTGRIYIPFQGAESEATWDGGAGENDTLVTTAANWTDDVLPDFEGGLTAIFATGGRTATFASSTAFDAIRFSSPQGFTLKAADVDAEVVLAGGIAAADNTGETVVTNTLEVPVVMTGEQSWTTPQNTVLEIRGPVSAEAATKLVFDGEGAYDVYSTNTFPGPVLLSKGATRVYAKKGAFGVSENGSNIALRYDQGATLSLYGTEIDKPFTLVKPSGNNYGGLNFAAGTSNAFLQAFNAGHNWVPRPSQGAVIAFLGGATVGSYFRPIMTAGSVKMIFGGKASSFGTGAQFCGGTVAFNASSNTIDNVYVRVNTTIELNTPNAFVNGGDVFPPLYMEKDGNNASYVRLNGNDQSFGDLNIANPYGYITTPSDKPATFSFAQTSDWTPRADVFKGPISLSKGGSATVTINGKMTLTGGDLTVTGGTLAFGESGVLSSVTNITVNGEGSLVTLVSKANLPNHKESILRLNDGGKLQIPSGMNLKVAELYIDGDKRRDGNYTAGNAADIVAGEGSLIVGSPALKILIR